MKKYRAWLGPVASLLLLCPWIMGATECNLFAGSANKSSDAALMYTAQQQINASNYTAALSTLSSVSPATLSTHAGLLIQATANAGQCGLNLVNLAQDVSNMTTGTSIMQLMLSYMSAATSYTNCKAAETEILSMVPAQITSDDYVFLAFIEMAKIGAVLETSPSAADPTHSGVVSTAFTPCNASATGISDAEVGEIGVSLDLALSAITNSGVSLASSLTSVLNSVCLPMGLIDCTVTSASSFTSAELKLLRTAINTSDLGLNTCPGTFTTGSCLCL